MTQEEFIKTCDEQYRRRMLIINDEKKARDMDDRLMPLKRMAYAERKNPHDVCMTLCHKQFIDLVDIAQGRRIVDDNYAHELISDVQNYLDFLNALMLEESLERNGVLL